MGNTIFKKIKSKLKNWSNSKTRSFNLTELFDTSDMAENEISEFLLIDNHKEICEMLLIEICRYNDKNTINYKEVIDLLYDQGNVKNNMVFYKLMITCMCAYSIIEEKINSGGKFEVRNITYENYKNIISSNNEKKYYRGQTNFEWGLVPSCFRNYSFKTSRDGYFVDVEMLYKKYLDSGLIEKFNETIAVDKILNSQQISYDFISYMQHALSYSPLIDITSKPEIGLQFALSNKSRVNDFLGQQAALFEFEVMNDQDIINSSKASELLKSIEFNVKILKDKIKPGKIMFVEDSSGQPKKLDFSSITNIIDNLRPKFKIIDTILNDRMRYQHGKFILFYDYVLVNNRILYTLNSNLNVIQYVIQIQSKKNIYKDLNEKYPYYNMDYLMNPYDYFNK